MELLSGEYSDENETFEGQLEKFKALKRLVKEEDLRLREAENHLNPELTNLPAELTKSTDVFEFLSHGEALLQEVETTVAEFCDQVETSRKHMNEELQKVTDEIEQGMKEFLEVILKVMEIDIALYERKERQKQQELDRSKAALEEDETFRALFRERQAVCDEQKEQLKNLKWLDANKVATWRKRLHELMEEKKRLKADLKKVRLLATQSFLDVPFLDRDTANLLDIFTCNRKFFELKSSTPAEDSTPADASIENRSTSSLSPLNTLERNTLFLTRASLRHRGSVAAVATEADNAAQDDVTRLFFGENGLYPLPDGQKLNAEEHTAVMDTVALKKRDYQLTKKLTRYLQHPQISQGLRPTSAAFAFSSCEAQQSDSDEKSVNCAKQRVLAQTLLNLTSLDFHDPCQFNNCSFIQEEPYFQTLLKHLHPIDNDFQRVATPRFPDTCGDYHDAQENSVKNVSKRPMRRRPPPPHQVF